MAVRRNGSPCLLPGTKNYIGSGWEIVTGTSTEMLPGTGNYFICFTSAGQEPVSGTSRAGGKGGGSCMSA